MQDWEWYKDINTKVLFIHLLLTANIKECKYMGKEIPRGCVITTISKLSEETGLTPREVRTAIKHLISTGEIEVKTTNKNSIIKVHNYNVYQASIPVERQANDNQAPNQRQTNDKPIEEEGEEGEEERVGAAAPAPPPPPSSKPPQEARHKRGQYGWVKLTDHEYARLIAEYGEATAKHYIAVVDEKAQITGNKNKWKDWNLTVRNAIKGQWGGPPPGTSNDSVREEMERMYGKTVNRGT